MTAPTITFGHWNAEECATLWDTTVYTTSGIGLVTTTIDDPDLSQADDYWNGFLIKYLTGANAGLYRGITNFDQATHTLEHGAFPNVTGSGDTYVFSKWRRTAGTPNLNGDTLTTAYDSWVTMGCVAAQADDHTIFDLYKFTSGVPATGSTDTYCKVYVRWKTETTGTGLGLTATAVYTDFSSDYIIGTLWTTPQFSTTFKVSSLTLDASKTLDCIRFFPYVHHDTAGNTTASVYVDWVLVCKGVFTFPFTPDTESVDMENVYADLLPISSEGERSQHLGSKSFEFELVGNTGPTNPALANLWTGGTGAGYDGSAGYGLFAERFYQLPFEMKADPWQYFTCNDYKGRVTVRKAKITRDNKTNSISDYHIILKEYNDITRTYENYGERSGLIP